MRWFEVTKDLEMYPWTWQIGTKKVNETLIFEPSTLLN